MRLIPEAWPGALQTVARLLGDEAAAAVARGLGGRRLYLPPAPGRRHPLAKLVGLQGARLVAEQLVGSRGDDIDWPAARSLIRAVEARKLKAAGLSEAAIAQNLGITQRHVRHLVGHVAKGAAENAAGDEAEHARTCPVCGHRMRPRTQQAEDTRQLPLPLT